jgi:hypothetical protein
MATIVRRCRSVRWDAAAVALAALVGACRQEPSRENPPPRPSAPAKPQGPKLSPEEEAVKDLLLKYSSVATCMDRLPLVLHGEANRKVLETYYKTRSDCKLRQEKIDVSDCKSVDGNRYCYPVATWRGKNHESHYCVVKSPQGYLIDWRCSVGYTPVPLVTFTAQHVLSEPSLFRLYARLSDVYKAEFSKALRTHHALTLRDRDGKTVQGYLARASVDAAKVFDELKDGKEHALVVELGYGKLSTDPDVVEVRRLVGIGHQERPEELAAPSRPAGQP